MRHKASCSLLGIALQRGLLPWHVGALPLGDRKAVVLLQPGASTNAPVFSRPEQIFYENKSRVM